MTKIFIIVWISFCSICFAATYYVDASGGNDLNDGTSEDQPWKTIQKVNITDFKPGDIICLKANNVWREQLNITSSGKQGHYITIKSYGDGSSPVISGADINQDFLQYNEDIWTSTLSSSPTQLFVDNERGVRKYELAGCIEENNWYFNTSTKKIYLRKSTPPDSIFIETAVRQNAIFISGSFIHIKDIQLEKSANNAIEISETSENIIVENVTLLQWGTDNEGNTAGIFISGKNVEVKDCVFGRNTGDEIADQNWGGIDGVRLKDGNAIIHNNQFFHNSIENENSSGLFSHGIFVENFSGNVKIYDNYIYHTGSHGIRVSGYSLKGDSIFIFNNTVEYPGQSGISAFKTRGDDGEGGTGFIFRNKVSFANRLGGDVGSGGSQSCGIHVNDGVIEYTEPEKPFIKWYIYDNIIHNNQSHADSTSQDSGGIIADFNAHNTEIFRNLVFDNWGKGISVWNANNTKIYYNIVYGNDAGLVVTAANNSNETANNHLIYNNTFYKNFNGFDKGSNLNTEIYFGKNGHNSIIRNNIFYASDEGYACTYDSTNSSGIILDHNLLYKDEGESICYDNLNRRQTFEQWKENHPKWDKHSINLFPNILVAGPDPGIQANSPAIDRGFDLGQSLDFKKNPIVGAPDIGAIEYHRTDSVKDPNLLDGFALFQNYPNPFNPVTVFEFQIPIGKSSNSELVTLKIYDVLGNEVATVINEERGPGKYQIKFEASNLSSGVYYYRLTAGRHSETKKMVLIK